MKKLLFAAVFALISLPAAAFAGGKECADGNCKCGNDTCAKGAVCVNNQCVCGESDVSWGYAWDSCESDKTNMAIALYDKGYGDFVCESSVVDGGTAGYTTAYRYECQNPNGCKLPNGKMAKNGDSYPWKIDETKEDYEQYADFSQTLYGASYMCAEDALDTKTKSAGKIKCKENAGVKLTEKEILACVNDYNASAPDLKYSIVPVHAITYKGKKKPSWLIFFNQKTKESCAVITNSKYDILQENRWCIPILNYRSLEDSFAGASVTYQFSERKVCKNGSKEKPSTGDRESYCKDLFDALKNEAKANGWVSLAEICAKNPDGKMKEFCGYLY